MYFFYVTSNLHKTETSLRWTVGAGPEGVLLGEQLTALKVARHSLVITMYFV